MTEQNAKSEAEIGETDLSLKLHEHGFRKEAGMLRRENRRILESVDYLKAQNQDMRNSLQDKFQRVLITRDNPLRRELLITLHNCLEHCRAFGEVVPHFDFVGLGFKDSRTLQRSCNRFAEMGFLVKNQSNPTAFELNKEIVEGRKNAEN